MVLLAILRACVHDCRLPVNVKVTRMIQKSNRSPYLSGRNSWNCRLFFILQISSLLYHLTCIGLQLLL